MTSAEMLDKELSKISIEMLAKANEIVDDNDGDDYSLITNPRKVFIDNIDNIVHERMLESCLTEFGAIKECAIYRDPVTKKSLGKGCAEFVEEKCAQLCINASKEARLLLGNRHLIVNYYKKKPDSNKSKNKTKISPAEMERNSLGVEIEPTRFEENLAKRGDNENDSNGIHINDLPYQLLISIFSNLCIRDLCIAEQGNESLI